MPRTEFITWLQGKDDYRRDADEVTWLSLLREMKQFLIKYPDKRDILVKAIRDSGMSYQFATTQRL